MSAQTREICRPNAELALADGNDDGVISIEEIDKIIELTDGNADLQSVRDRAVAAGITGIRYRGCNPNAGSDTREGTPVGTPADGTPAATPLGSTPGTISTMRASAVDEADTGSAIAISGRNLLLVGTGGVLILAGAVILRVGHKA